MMPNGSDATGCLSLESAANNSTRGGAVVCDNNEKRKVPKFRQGESTMPGEKNKKRPVPKPKPKKNPPPVPIPKKKKKRNNNRPKSLASRDLKTKVLSKFLHQVMLPDRVNVNDLAIPPSIVQDVNLSMHKLYTSSVLDVAAASAALQSSVHPPLLENGSTVWNRSVTAGWQLVQCQDAAFPLCAPLACSPAVADDFPKRWVFGLVTVDSARQYLATSVPDAIGEAIDIKFTTLGQSHSANPQFPAGWRTRPVFAVRDPSRDEQMIWVDASPSKQANVDLYGDLRVDFADQNASYVLTFFAIRVHSDGVETYSHTETTPLTIVSGQTVSMAVPLRLQDSGFYKLKMQLTCRNSVSTVFSWSFLGGNIQQAERTDIGTAFFQNTVYTMSAGANGKSMYPLGIGTKCTYTALPLLTSGLIHGANVSSIATMFYQATSVSREQVFSRISATETYNCGSGRNIQNGLWMYARPRSWSTEMFPVTASRLNDDATNVPLSYWPALDYKSVALNVAYFFPNNVSPDTPLIMNISQYTVLALSIKTQFISRTDFSMLRADDLDAARILLAEIANFSPNEWHDVFAKIADRAAAAGRFLLNGAATVTKYAPAAVEAMEHAAAVALAVSKFAALLL